MSSLAGTVGEMQTQNGAAQRRSATSLRAADVFLVPSASTSWASEDWDRKQHTHTTLHKTIQSQNPDHFKIASQVGKKSSYFVKS